MPRPANLLPRYVLGAEALSPGWKQARIRPHPGTLAHAKGKIPTPLGPIDVGWENGNSFQMNLSLPDGMTAKLELPAPHPPKGFRSMASLHRRSAPEIAGFSNNPSRARSASK